MLRKLHVSLGAAVVVALIVSREARIAAIAGAVVLVAALAFPVFFPRIKQAPGRLLALRVAAPIVATLSVAAGFTVGWVRAVAVVLVTVGIWWVLDVGVPSLWNNRALIAAWTRSRLDRSTVGATRDLAAEIAAAGWTAYHAAHRFREVDKAPEPGSDAFVILYELTDEPWVGAKVVEVTDASVEGGGRERRALVVGRHHTSAAAALAATAGLTPDLYMPARQT